MRSFIFGTCFLATVSVFASGCAAAVEGVDADEEVASSQDELSFAARLEGAYVVTDSTGLGYPRTEALVLSSDKTFFANVDTGLRCFRAPCPSQARLEGTFRATKRTLTLTYAGADGKIENVRYAYDLVRDTLKLTAPGGRGEVSNFKKQATFCSEATDCASQSFIHIMCMGHYTCTAENTCGYSCRPEPKPRICESDIDCGEGGTCNPGMCLMYCAAGDESCCAPSRCSSGPRD